MSEIIDEAPAPPPPPPATSAGTASAGAAASFVNQTVDLTTNGQSTVTVAGEQNFWVQEQVIHVSRQSRAAVRPFACRDGVDLSDDEEQAVAGRFAGGEMDALVTHLYERRVLLLSAQRGAGKVSAAISLGAHLRQEQKCTRTVVADSLDRQVRIDVRHLAERDKGLAGRLVIFRKPFGRADPELARLFEKTDRSGWEQLTARLRQQNAYLVFTADPEDAAGFRDRLAAQGLLRELQHQPRGDLEERLDEKLERLAGDGAAEEALRALDRGRDELLGTFHFGSSLAEFADFYVDHYRPDLGVAEAIARFHDTSEWLLQELEQDFEFWSFGFTLALAQCVRDARGVAWLDFDRLHRRVRQWLRRDLNRPAAPAEGEGDDEVEIHPALSEAPLLRRCRAVIVKDSSTLADIIQFRDGVPTARLWTVIMDRHRRALTTILPGLRDLAEGAQDDLRSLRELAAQILGRIGEVDPERIIHPLLERWMRSDKGRHHALVGPLFEGVMGSTNERYRTLCFDHLRKVWRSAPSRGRAGMQGLHAAIGAYSWIGDHDLGLAMRELGEIARVHLVPMVADVQELARMLSDLENERKQQGKAGEGANTLLVSCQTLLAHLMSRIYREKGPTLLGMQASLVSLCLTAGPIPVFRELRRWIAQGGWKTGVLVALMFLHESGIASALTAARVEGGAGDGPVAAPNPLVESMGRGDDEVLQTARFLGDLYESLSTPHKVDATLLRHCRDSLQDHLLGWVRDAVPLPEYASSMRSLLQATARTHEGILRAPLEQLLARREFSDPTEPKLRAFAASVVL